MLFSLLIMWIKKFKYQAEVVKILQYQKTLRTVFILTVLFSDVLLIGHFGSCLFLFIDLTLWNEQYYGNNTSLYWLSNNSSYANTDLFGGLWYLQYIYAQSFSTGTLSTLAPGPFAKNPIEIVIISLKSSALPFLWWSTLCSLHHTLVKFWLAFSTANK